MIKAEHTIELLKIDNEREIYIRTKINEFYIFMAKLIISFASATIAFSISAIDFRQISDTSLILHGWGFLLISICLIFCVMRRGIHLHYIFLNNIYNNKPEISDETLNREKRIPKLIYFAFIFLILGIIVILYFVQLPPECKSDITP